MEHSPISALEGLKGKMRSLRQTNEDSVALLTGILARLDDLPAAGEMVSSIQFARRIHRSRMRAHEIMGPSIVRDPRWEMLLELFIAYHEQRRVSVSSLCNAANAPATTSLRHIDMLEQLGFTRRIEDALDARRSWIEPTPKAVDSVGAMLREMQRAA